VSAPGIHPQYHPNTPYHWFRFTFLPNPTPPHLPPSQHVPKRPLPSVPSLFGPCFNLVPRYCNPTRWPSIRTEQPERRRQNTTLPPEITPLHPSSPCRKVPHLSLPRAVAKYPLCAVACRWDRHRHKNAWSWRHRLHRPRLCSALSRDKTHVVHDGSALPLCASPAVHVQDMWWSIRVETPEGLAYYTATWHHECKRKNEERKRPFHPTSTAAR
jgi:hypothetical protein